MLTRIKEYQLTLLILMVGFYLINQALRDVLAYPMFASSILWIGSLSGLLFLFSENDKRQALGLGLWILMMLCNNGLFVLIALLSA